MSRPDASLAMEPNRMISSESIASTTASRTTAAVSRVTILLRLPYDLHPCP